jgi:hypothetical protein
LASFFFALVVAGFASDDGSVDDDTAVLFSIVAEW